jgi:hypothetical protein
MEVNETFEVRVWHFSDDLVMTNGSLLKGEKRTLCGYPLDCRSQPVPPSELRRAAAPLRKVMTKRRPAQGP